MKEFIKKFILMVIILIIIIIIILVNINRKKENLEIIEDPDDPELSVFEIDNSIQPVKVRNDFYVVKNCVNKFFSYYMETNLQENEKYIYDEEQENNNDEVLFSMLDDEYINFNNITKNNIIDKLPKQNEVTVQIDKMYFAQENKNINSYFVYGTLNDKVNNQQTEFSIVVKTDILNKTFKVILEDYIEKKYGNIQLGNKIKTTDDNSQINNDNYNIFDYKFVLDDEYVTDLFNKLKEDLLYNRKNAYNSLNNEYREKKFKNYNEFEKYLKDNVLNCIKMKISSYKKDVYDEYTQYVCMDENGEYYIFRETSVMNYEVILDTYTLDLPEFIEKYNSSNDQTKVGMNIEKVFEAINKKDYQYVYNKLDNTFKNNNYKTLEDFEKYIGNNLYSNNNVEYSKFSTQGENYIYELKITEGNNTSSKEKDVTIVMKLEEGTNFVMSFNIE